ncbi:hypothetical protein OEZ85_012956 [Tetradesmus obliquus]|uniref:alpha-1,2-Mannosidase n=1 Tax=Tetradesmus obliquus TaxID=3088 RepID=A0ABY8U4G5_TETOB|nr:hypothetical protein OEZ85_012956 [Tetradesmus obliquus]
MALKQQPANAGLPRRAPTPFEKTHSKTGWERFYIVAVTVSVSALLATLITFGVLNFLMSDVQLPSQHAFGELQGAVTLQQPDLKTAPQQQMDGRGAAALLNATAPAAANTSLTAHSPAAAPLIQPPPAVWTYPLEYLKGYYQLPPQDTSSRCQQSKICDGDHSCGPDGLGCITSAKERQDKVRNAIAWAWAGYRQHAWGHDEVNGLSKTPRGWFNMGLTIVDSLDTLMIAGLHEEVQQARHWVANHLQFKDGNNVQFFEVNIRILGGLLSAYYLSDGDDLYLHKAQQLADRLMVAFNTSSGIPVTYVQFADAEGRKHSSHGDSGTNAAEAGTISMEFTTIGRLLGRDDMFDAGNEFWYVLMTSQNFSGLYCMGLHTQDGHCTDPKMSIGSAADSMYEYMIKQWVLSNKTQEVPLQLYKEAMVGVRKFLLRHIYDGTAHMSFVSEARGNSYNDISATNDRFEHLTCFAGGMFLLGRMHNISTKLHDDDFDDGEVGARIGRACYEMYHQVPSGVAPDSIQYTRADGGTLPPNDHSARSRMAPPKLKGPRKRTQHKKAPAAAAKAPEGDAAVQQAPKPADAAGAVEKPEQAKRAPKPEDAAQQVQPGPVIAKWSQQSSADFLRPEAIETLFYLWRSSGDPIYREWGWNMFRGFERWCRLASGGYATLNNVNTVPPGIADKMESFFVAETLKYFYMLFEEDPTVLPLDQWVFNTEAHPLPIWGSAADKKAQERLRQRRLAQHKLEQQRHAEAEALREQEALQQRTQQVAGGKGTPKDRDGYGLAGLV